MRLFPLAFIPLLLAPFASAHGTTGAGELAHLSVKALELRPGETYSVPIYPGPDEGPWRKDMVFILYVRFANATRNVRAELVYDHGLPVQTWTLRDSEVHYASTRIPHDEGPYELALTNLDPERNTQLYTYFDQTCNCAFKPIPMNTGWVVLHYDLPAGKEHRIGVPLAVGWQGRATLATVMNPAAQWPGDFEVVDEAQAGGPQWLNVTVAPPKDQRYYLVVFADEGAIFPPSPYRAGFTVTVDIESQDRSTPAPGAFAFTLLVVAAAMVWSRRR